LFYGISIFLSFLSIKKFIFFICLIISLTNLFYKSPAFLDFSCNKLKFFSPSKIKIYFYFLDPDVQSLLIEVFLFRLKVVCAKQLIIKFMFLKIKYFFNSMKSFPKVIHKLLIYLDIFVQEFEHHLFPNLI
jgi:hypothetical protein